MLAEHHQIQLVGVSDVMEGVAQNVSRLVVLILEIANIGVAKYQTRKHLNTKMIDLCESGVAYLESFDRNR